MTDTGLDVVTGAFSYSGQAIAQALHGAGRRIRTLTNHPRPGGAAVDIEVKPLDFGRSRELAISLTGATTLYNTYWVRFPRGGINHDVAVENSRTLLQAARQAGLQRVVQLSILHPSTNSPYSYFRGKALVEQALVESGLSHAILRPSVLFDENGVLLNNIAWLLRRFPLFAIGGNGRYRVRPIHVADLARLALEAANWPEDRVVDAVGPERPTFVDLVEHIRAAVGSRARLIKVPPRLLLAASRALSLILRDVLLTGPEYHAMADGLADSVAPSTGSVELFRWITEHAEVLGTTYANELDRHFR